MTKNNLTHASCGGGFCAPRGGGVHCGEFCVHCGGGFCFVGPVDI